MSKPGKTFFSPPPVNFREGHEQKWREVMKDIFYGYNGSLRWEYVKTERHPRGINRTQRIGTIKPSLMRSYKQQVCISAIRMSYNGSGYWDEGGNIYINTGTSSPSKLDNCYTYKPN
jgi:hypothetical protein